MTSPLRKFDSPILPIDEFGPPNGYKLVYTGGDDGRRQVAYKRSVNPRSNSKSQGGHPSARERGQSALYGSPPESVPPPKWEDADRKWSPDNPWNTVAIARCG